MNTNKIVIGTIAGGVAFFLLGWLIYGMLLTEFMKANYNQCAMKPMEDMIWWAMILSNLVWALLYAMLFSWTNTSTLMSGAKMGFIIGFLIILSFDLSFYAMSNMFFGRRALCVDILAGTITSTIGGAVIGWVMGMGKKAA